MEDARKADRKIVGYREVPIPHLSFVSRKVPIYENETLGLLPIDETCDAPQIVEGTNNDSNL